MATLSNRIELYRVFRCQQIHDESQPLRVTTCFAASRGAATLASLAGHSHVGPGARDRLQVSARFFFIRRYFSILDDRL